MGSCSPPGCCPFPNSIYFDEPFSKRRGNSPVDTIIWYVNYGENRVIFTSLCFLKVPFYCPFCRFTAPWWAYLWTIWLAVVRFYEQNSKLPFYCPSEIKSAVILPAFLGETAVILPLGENGGQNWMDFKKD